MYDRISFEIEKKSLLREIEQAKEVVEVNKLLNLHNYAFVHPYLFGYQIKHFNSLGKNKTLSREKISHIFSTSFFDLRVTAHFIEGFFKHRPNLKPFLPLIDQSVILCLQKDYAGAINTLLPVIEGAIRHYLVNNKGKQNEKIMKSEELIKVFYHIKEDYTNLQKARYIKAQENGSLDANQVKQLVRYATCYIDQWFSIIEDYFSKSLYFDTRDGKVHDSLNRHSIFHGFNSDIYYSLDNYLKVFNSIIFLSWAFGLADLNAKVLSAAEDEEIEDKWIAFEKIRTISKITTKIKSSVYSAYPDFDILAFEQYYDKDPIEVAIAKLPAKHLEHRLELIDLHLRGKKNQESTPPKSGFMKRLFKKIFKICR